MPCAFVKPVLDESVRKLCYRPYPNHKKGCPNYGKRPVCPPQAPLLSEFLDLNYKVMAVWVAMDFAAHVQRMKEKHPNWSQRQLECCLYWQGTMAKRLRRWTEYQLTRTILFDTDKPLVATYCPEAMGVNVTETMKRFTQVRLEWPPQNIVYKISFVGVARDAAQNTKRTKCE